MTDQTPGSLVALLQGVTLRNRTGLLLLPSAWLGRESEAAVRLAIGYGDLQVAALASVAPGQKYLGLSWSGLIDGHISPLLRDSRPDGGCLLASNVDILLSALKPTDRGNFWRFLREDFRPSWGLILTLPETTRRLITDEEIGRWAADRRLTCWPERGV